MPPEQLQEIGRDIATLTEQTSRPIACPMLDRSAGACRVYAHRPVACRTYGFYVQHDQELYCKDIELRMDQGDWAEVVLGNQGLSDQAMLRELPESCTGRMALNLCQTTIGVNNMNSVQQTPDDVLTFWFEEITPKQWWATSDDLDRKIESHFGALHYAARHCELCRWRESAKGRLAEIIVLDQFSRNIYRNHPNAFAYAVHAQRIAVDPRSCGCPVQSARYESKPTVRASAQGNHRPFRPLSAPQRNTRSYINTGRDRFSENRRFVVLNNISIPAIQNRNIFMEFTDRLRPYAVLET